MKHFAISIILGLLLSPFAHAQQTSDDFFPLGLWYEGGGGNARDNVLPADPVEAAKVYEQNFADIAAHGINVIVIPNSPPEHHKIVLDTAQKHGLKVILELGLDGGPLGHMIRGQRPMDDKVIQETLKNTLGPIKDHPALLRVQLLDEPPDDAFVRYGKIAEATRVFAPRTGPFCCLVGVVDGDRYLKETKSDVIAFDTYPIGAGAKPGDEAPLRGFADYAARFPDWAEKHSADSWAVIQCHEITGGLRYPTPAEMRCMTYTSLAAGNRGIYWFLYQSEAVGQAMMNGLVDRQFKSRPLWDEVAKLSAEIKPITSVLSLLKPDRATKAQALPGGAYVLRDAKGGAYLFAINFDAAKEQQLHMMFPDKGVSKVTRVRDGSAVTIKRENGHLAWTDPFAPGDGALYRVE